MTATALTTATLQSAAVNGSGSTISASSLLQQIFGAIATDPMSALTGGLGGSSGGAGGDYLSTVFMYINMGLITLGGLYVTFKSFSAVTQTAHDGEFLGKAYHSIWVPIRITTGIFSLLPVFGGYSAMQVVMLWFGVLGAGLGNLAWQDVSGSFVPYNTLSVSMSPSSSFNNSFVSQVYLMNACVAAHNAQLKATTITASQPAWGTGPLVPDQSGNAWLVNFGSNGGYNAECGSISFANLTTATASGSSTGYATLPMFGSAASNIGQLNNTTERTLSQFAVTDFQNLNNSMQTQALSYVSAIVTSQQNASTPGGIGSHVQPFDPSAMATAQANYNQQIMTDFGSALSGLDMSSSIKSAMMTSAQTDGFTAAGAWYTSMASMSAAYTQLAQIAGASIASKPIAPTQADFIWNPVYTGIETVAAVANSSMTNPASVGSTSDSSSSAAWQKIMGKIGTGISTFSGQGLVNRMVNDNTGEPAILRMKDIGDFGMGAGAAVLTAVGAIEGAIDGATSNNALVTIGNTLTGGGAGSVAGAGWGAIKPWLDMAGLVAKAAFGGCLTLSLYIPMIPFVVFMGQVLAWLLSVIEGVAAAPFLAFAHLDASGEEGLGQRTNYGYTFMLQSFMRPVMLVFGFIVASKMVDVMGGYLMNIYPEVIANVQMNSLTGFLSIIMLIAIFLMLSISIINSCMSIMYILPEAMWSFMGAHSSQTTQTGRNMEQSVANIGSTTAIASIVSSKKTEKEKEQERAKKARLRSSAGGMVTGKTASTNDN